MIFGFSSNEIDLDEITAKMGLSPTRTRRKEDYPWQSIEAGLAKTYWDVEIRENHSNIIIPFRKLIDILSSKVNIINELSCKFNCATYFDVVIHACAEKWLPIIEVSKDIMTFVISINADIGFDIYYDMSELSLK